jgi:hypothetical protein
MFRAIASRAALAAPSAIVLLVARGTSAAEAPHLAELRYVRDLNAESCADQHELESKVSTRLGYVPFREGATLIVTARISRNGSGFKALLSSDDLVSHIRGAREIQSAASDCGELLESVALAISVAIDPLTLSRPPAPVVIHEVAPFPVAAPVPPTPAPQTRIAPVTEPPSSTPTMLEASFGAVTSVGAAPAPSFGVVAAVGLRRRIASLAVEGRADAPSSTNDVGGRRVSSNLVVGSLVPCVRPGAFSACANVSLGVLNGAGSGVDLSSPKTTFYAAAGPRGGVEWAPFKGLAFGAYAEVLAVLTRTDLRLNNQIVWTTPPFAGGLGLRAIGRLP